MLTSTCSEPSPPAAPHVSKDPGEEIGGTILARRHPKKSLYSAHIYGVFNALSDCSNYKTHHRTYDAAQNHTEDGMNN